MDHPKYAAVLMNGNKWCGSRAKQPLAIPSKVFEFSIGWALTNALFTIKSGVLECLEARFRLNVQDISEQSVQSDSALVRIYI